MACDNLCNFTHITPEMNTQLTATDECNSLVIDADFQTPTVINCPAQETDAANSTQYAHNTAHDLILERHMRRSKEEKHPHNRTQEPNTHLIAADSAFV